MELPALPDCQRWAALTLIEQMANIGSEVGRTYKWLSKSKPQMAQGAFFRALDLIDLTIRYGRYGEEGRGQLLKELCRCRDEFTSAVLTNNLESLQSLDRYFGHFAKCYATTRTQQPDENQDHTTGLRPQN